MHIRSLILVALALTLGACSNVYYDAMEKVGVHKRDILVDRVEAGHAERDQGAVPDGDGTVPSGGRFFRRRS